MKMKKKHWPWDRFLLIRSLSRGSGSHFSLDAFVSMFQYFFQLLKKEISISHLSIPMAWELAGSEEDHLNEVELRATHHHLSRGQTTIRSSVLGQLELLAPMHMSGNHD